MLKLVGKQLDDGRWFTQAAERNKDPILAVLARFLPSSGLVLEIASGTGQHVVHFAANLPQLEWQPSDPDADLRESVQRRIREAGLTNVRNPIDLDVRRQPWPLASADAVVCINMIHVAPWEATDALLTGAAGVMSAGGALVLYGPYRRFGAHTAPSNASFDAQLRATDPAWGLRDMESVIERAATAGFELADVVDMPANNFSVVFRTRTAG
jgi:cyclopropane fatty-acyl-phospholipid synthase-like methyltransferase